MSQVLLVTSPLFLRHRTPPGHPERPERLAAILEALRQSGLEEVLRQTEEVAPVARDLLEAVHRPQYIEEVAQVARGGGGYLDPDTYVSPESFDVALAAAGGAVAAVEEVLSGRAQAAFALLRPPGHHALAAKGMGFCLFNNAALAAVAARDRHGLHRIAVIDWDVHHGNGTQDLFYHDPSVLYVSTHREHWYPGTGRWEEVGAGAGEGFTLNIPLPPGIGDEGYRLIFEEVVVPLLDAARPELVLASAGYDAHFADPLGGMLLTAAGFRTLAQLTVEATARVGAGFVGLLEGGYDLSGLSTSVIATLEVLTHRSAGLTLPQPGFQEVPYTTVRERIRRARSLALNYWRI
ncbi:MAG: histone deacetylase [Armatimonadota bacterium]|nr:histone deacetylase [Armatimonadota bacterium]